MHLRPHCRFCLLAALLLATARLSAQAVAPLSIGETHTLHSAALQEDRLLHVYLPVAPADSTGYPVIYLLDGSLHEDFLHTVGLVQFFNLMYGMPPCIVVGISNVDRKRDFTFPTQLADLQAKYPTTGGSAAFIAFLETELIPYIDGRYATAPARYLIGQSLGGLLATEVLLRKRHLFTHYLIVSPSLWWDNESLLAQAADQLRQGSSRPYVYVSVGEEGRIMEREAKALHRLLQQHPDACSAVDFVRMRDENHATILHSTLYQVFKRLFPYQAP
ncbi:MAG: alpha/beta hydrolase-fold protein [Bacteroidia bacterium]